MPANRYLGASLALSVLNLAALFIFFLIQEPLEFKTTVLFATTNLAILSLSLHH